MFISSDIVIQFELVRPCETMWSGPVGLFFFQLIGAVTRHLQASFYIKHLAEKNKQLSVLVILQILPALYNISKEPKTMPVLLARRG